MGKKSPKNKWLDLLGFVGWEDYVVWKQFNNTTQEKGIVEIKAWAKKQIKFLPEQNQEVFNHYYLGYGNDVNVDSYYYKLLDQTRVALKGMYGYERSKDREEKSNDS